MSGGRVPAGIETAPLRTIAPRGTARARFELTTDAGVVSLYDGGTGPTESWPCVRSAAAGDRCLDLGENDGWAHAEVLSDRRTIVALLDCAVESEGHELKVVVSPDAGRTWIRRGSISKPHYMARFLDLELGGPGRPWTVAVWLEGCADCGVRTGVYVYASADDGRTWVLREEAARLVGPAGLGWQTPRHAHAPLCEITELACAAVTAVVVGSIARDPQAAAVELARVRRDGGAAATGYPFVATTAELGLAGAPNGIAIVLGSFTNPRWAAGFARLRGEPHVYAASTAKGASHAVEIVHTKPVPAFAPSDLWDDPKVKDSGLAAPETILRRAPACLIDPGSVFVVPDDAIEMNREDWVAVECRGRGRAYVQRERTSLDRIEDDRVRRQYMGTVCDTHQVRDVDSGRLVSGCAD